MKHGIAILLAAVLLLTLTGCSGSSEQTKEPVREMPAAEAPGVPATVPETKAPQETPAAEPQETPAAEPEPEAETPSSEEPEEEEPVKQQTPALEAETPPAQEPQAGIRPEVKEVIDRYVEFLEEYVAFLEHYDASDLSQLSRYMQLYMEYLEYMEKNDEVLDDLTDEESMYMVKRTLELEQKMLDTIGKMK